jgi:superfamily II DNA or RNA helicase
MKKTILRIQNCYSWLYCEKPEVLNVLHENMRFREKGYFHSRLYKQKLWDGYTEFFSKKTGRFLTGLLPEVKAALLHIKENYDTIDERQEFNFLFEQIDENFLSKNFKLYDYQVDLTNALLKYKRGVICAPTASGKTNIMLSILKALPENCPTLVLANKTSLVQQNYEEIIKAGIKNVGRLYGKYKDPNITTCSTVQSLHKIESILEKIKVVIVDEIHENMSKQPKKYFNKMKNCSVRAAVSATPFKFGGKDLCQKWLVKGYFGPALKSKSAGGILTTSHLQDRGMLSKSRCVFYPVREPDLKYEIYMDAVTRGIAENWHFHEIIKNLALRLSGRTLILVERIAQGDSLHSLIPGSLWVQGKDDLDTRKFVIDKLKTSKEKIVSIGTQQIFTAGINVMTHNVINAAGGQADHQIIQRVGRGLRTAKDKEILNYYDFVFHNNEYLHEHSKKRIKILEKEGHEIIFKENYEEI